MNWYVILLWVLRVDALDMSCEAFVFTHPSWGIRDYMLHSSKGVMDARVRVLQNLLSPESDLNNWSPYIFWFRMSCEFFILEFVKSKGG